MTVEQPGDESSMLSAPVGDGAMDPRQTGRASSAALVAAEGAHHANPDP